MSKVHILPEDIISKIAAGEVIERPASVVKELLENSLDADATSIEINLKNAGKSLIQIRDNGSGIEKDDLEKIFTRHATSKISDSDDLYNIKSLGFRGEALYSIASIADVTLKSKTEGQDSGWEIHLRDGKRLDFRPSALGNNGTELEIKELFFNTPARRKFLKSDITEIHQILNTFIPYTLIYNNCRFLLTHQNKSLVELNEAPDLINRISESLHIRQEHILSYEHNIEDISTQIKIFIGDINIVRSRRDMQFIFINNRPVANKSISFHLNNTARLIFPEGQCPFFAVYINMPAANIDVNIHPAKREVKIKNEQYLCTALRSICEQLLMSGGKIKKIHIPDETNKRYSAPIQKALNASSVENSVEKPVDSMLDFKGTSEQRPVDQYNLPQSVIDTTKDDLLSRNKTGTLRNKLNAAQYIGSFINKYLLFEIDKDLLFVDQHAAAERITYERLIAQMQKGKIEAQRLLSPILINLSPQEILASNDINEKLNALGFENSQYDNQTLAIHSYPVLIKDPQRAIREVLSGDDIARSDTETIARRACRSSVMTGERLNKEKAEYIKIQLLKCLDPFTCPHGRPTVIEMSSEFVDKQFLR